ncbi:hypothetical protein NQD34_015312, partial [Periophthalmus magnuspinnatus]
DYIGQRIREKSFDPKGKGTCTMLDDLAHYDLAISVALWWLNREEGRYVEAAARAQYPNHLEREAMILSSFAGMIVAAIVYPFTLSYHPFAMLSSYKAVHHSKKHSE